VTRDHLLLAAGIVVLTAVTFFRFPGHTILQSDTQIYIPILEHLWDPSVLAKDPMASRPHVVYTIYDEVALVLRKVTGLGFEQVLTAQQFVYRCLAVLGLWLIGRAAGLSPLLAFAAAAIPMLGAIVSGPSVLTVEYEPVPRGFALSFLLLSIGAAATNHWRTASIAASIGFLFHPPTAFFYCGLLLAVSLWQRRYSALLPFVVCGALFLMLVFVPELPPEGQEIFTRIDPALEALQRPRAAYNWVSMWFSKWITQYLILTAFCAVVLWRLWRGTSPVLRVLFAALAAGGLLSIGVSWLMLDYGKWMLGAQFQPGRYLLWVPLTAVALGAVAGVRAASRGSYIEAVLLLFPCFVLPLQPELLALQAGQAAIAAALAVLITVAARWPIAAAAAAFVLFFVMPPTPLSIHTPELNELSAWARENTPKDAMFLFADAGPGLEPGVFRARALRALYMDWKSGGQINFLRSFAAIWGERWPRLRRVRPLNHYRARPIDYLVFRRENAPKGIEPIWQNGRYVVVRNRSTSARVGTEAWAPMRVTERAAAAFAKRNAGSSSTPSDSATARAPLKMSPAAVVSTASTRKPGEYSVRAASRYRQPAAPSLRTTAAFGASASTAAASSGASAGEMVRGG
jgi:hypothetical protein